MMNCSPISLPPLLEELPPSDAVLAPLGSVVRDSVIISEAITAQSLASLPVTDCAENPVPTSRRGYLETGNVSWRGGIRLIGCSSVAIL